MTRSRLAAAALMTSAFVACGSAEKMNGFPENDARALVSAAAALDACTVRDGHLVLEIESVLVREYPHARGDVVREHKQPLLLLWVRDPNAGPGATVLTPLAAPEEYRAGDPVRFFAGRRLLDQPLRLMRGKRMELRLAENNRTAQPNWIRYASLVGQGAGGAVSAAGFSAPPAAVIDMAIDQLRNLDRDDLILLWAADIDGIVRELGASASDRRAVRYHAVTTRNKDGAPAGELSLLAFLEAEPGCP